MLEEQEKELKDLEKKEIELDVFKYLNKCEAISY